MFFFVDSCLLLVFGLVVFRLLVGFCLVCVGFAKLVCLVVELWWL